MTKIGLLSLGCSKNLIDSETMLGYLSQSDYELTTDPQEAQVLIVNTCGFIEAAKQESIDAILEMAAYKKDGNCQALVVTGCLAQRYREELRQELPEVDILLGINEYEKLPALLNRKFAPEMLLGPLQEKRILATPDHYAYLRIADGCDNRCSFCAIPMIRGRYRSRKMEEILVEAQDLAQRGVKELIVIAQDTTRYGIDLYGERKLPELLRALCRLDFQWIRLLYAYPRDITDALLDVIATEEKLLKYLDIPLQHVDDMLLKRMNRRSSIAELSSLYEKIHKCSSDFVLRSTFITGFPGETEEQHRRLMAFTREYPFNRVGVFCYSAEDGTPAAKFSNQVAREIAERRAGELMAQQESISQKLLEKRIGQTYEVLVEAQENDTDRYLGRSYGEAPEIDGVVCFTSARPLAIGDFVSVKINGNHVHDLYGRTEEDTFLKRGKSYTAG